MTDLSGQLQALVATLGYAVTLGVAAAIALLAAAAASFLLRWRGRSRDFALATSGRASSGPKVLRGGA